MLAAERYDYIKKVIDTGALSFPERITLDFIDGFVPAHLQCHLTAAQVAVETGWPPVVGIQFIDLHGKLYPWPHMVNRRADGGLVDCAPVPSQPVLGFIETGWDALDMWRQITLDYNAFGGRTEAPSWDDPLADRLTHDYLARLRAARAAVLAAIAVAPATQPTASLAG